MRSSKGARPVRRGGERHAGHAGRRRRRPRRRNSGLYSSARRASRCRKGAARQASCRASIYGVIIRCSHDRHQGGTCEAEAASCWLPHQGGRNGICWHGFDAPTHSPARHGAEIRLAGFVAAGPRAGDDRADDQPGVSCRRYRLLRERLFMTADQIRRSKRRRTRCRPISTFFMSPAPRPMRPRRNRSGGRNLQRTTAGHDIPRPVLMFQAEHALYGVVGLKAFNVACPTALLSVADQRRRGERRQSRVDGLCKGRCRVRRSIKPLALTG